MSGHFGKGKTLLEMREVAYSGSNYSELTRCGLGDSREKVNSPGPPNHTLDSPLADRHTLLHPRNLVKY